MIARWSFGLLRDTSAVLLDAEIASSRRGAIRAAIEAQADNRVADLHVWRVGPRHLAAIVSVVTSEPREPAHQQEREPCRETPGRHHRSILSNAGLTAA